MFYKCTDCGWKGMLDKIFHCPQCKSKSLVLDKKVADVPNEVATEVMTNLCHARSVIASQHNALLEYRKLILCTELMEAQSRLTEVINVLTNGDNDGKETKRH